MRQRRQKFFERRVWQDSDGSFSYTIDEFTADRLPPNEVP